MFAPLTLARTTDFHASRGATADFRWAGFKDSFVRELSIKVCAIRVCVWT